MKISRNKLKRLVEQSMKKVIVKEATKKANNWEEYVAVGKTEADKEERRKLWLMWELWTRPGNPSYALEEDNTLPVNPTQYLSRYEGWVDWYKDMIKNPEAMAAMGKKVGQHFSVDDHFKYVEKYFPDAAKLPSMKLKAKEITQQVVSDFMAGLKFGDAAKTRIDLDQPKSPESDMNLSSEPEKMIFGFKEDNKNSEGSTKAQSIESYLLTRASPPSQLPAIYKQQYPKQYALYAKNPKAFWRKANGKSEPGDEEAIASILNKKESEIAGSDKPEGSVEESKMMNENRIRAIIRHELIQSMRK